MGVPRTRLALAVVVLLVLALLPRALLWPAEYLQRPLVFVLGPVQQPVRSVVVWLRGGNAGDEKTPVVDVAELARERDEFQRAFLASQREIDELRLLVRDVARMSELNSSRAKLVVAPVIGTGADLSGGVMSVKAGRKDGVEKNSVAVVRGVHIVGRVQRADDRSCAVLPITDKSFHRFTGRIMLDETLAGPRCTLKPVGDGTLVGEVWSMSESPPLATANGGAAKSNALGAEVSASTLMDKVVRLDDETWPSGDQMLVIGRVTRVETSPTQMQRMIVHVQPSEEIARVSEVMIRVADTSSTPPLHLGTKTASEERPRP